MANCTKKDKIEFVTKEVVVKKLEEVKTTTYVLELTEEEAQVVSALVGNILGEDSTPRGITDKIYYALADRGIIGYNHFRTDRAVNLIRQ